MSLTKKMLCAVTLLVAGIVGSGFAQQDGWVSRYWDACKPHCGWSNNAGSAGRSAMCNQDNSTAGGNGQSACQGGPEYTCFEHAPVIINPTLAYGFVATPPGFADCGTCYEFEFTGSGQHGSGPTHQALAGKKMIVAKTNIGGDVTTNQFDLLVPGGGLGLHDAFSGQLNVNKSDLGCNSGGFLTTCTQNNGNCQANNNVALATAKDCLREKCNLFTNATLKAGCLFYVDFMEAANNPKVKWKTVSCPQALTDWYKDAKKRPTGSVITPTYTVTTSVNPTAGGSASGGGSYAANASVTLTATPANGYTFNNWTATSGSLPSGLNTTANPATFNMPSSNVSVRANFTQTVVTHTLQVARSPSNGGNVSVTVGTGSQQNNPSGSISVNNNTQVSITATPNNGYTFTRWEAVSGSLPTGVTATSGAAIQFNMTGAVNIRAVFTAEQQVTTYSLQVNRSSSSRGNVSVKVGNSADQQNPTNAITVNPNTSVTVTATPTEGNEFVNWTTSNSEGLPFSTATSATGTFTMTRNVNITANFRATGSDITTYTLNVGRNPTSGGNVSVNNGPNNPGQSTHDEGTHLSVTALPNSGYTFENWTAASGTLPTGITPTSMTIQFDISSNVNIVANFKRSGNGDGNRDTTKVEAEELTAPNLSNCNPSGNNPYCIGSNDQGITNIGWISGGDSAIYNVGLPSTGNYTMVFRIASNYDQGPSSFSVTVNGTLVGTISGHTNDWDGYTDLALSNDVPFNVGNNTIKLNFNTAVNVDYFLIIGEATVPIKHHAVKRSNVQRASHVSVRAISGGFVAGLPTDHAFTAYKILDLRGRELKRGIVGAGAADLYFENLKSGVVFLRLEGRKGTKPTVLRATTAR